MELRRDVGKSRNLCGGATDAEALLWKLLRARRLDGFKFRRQFPVSGFIADFVCVENNLIIELDGGQHGECFEYDSRRSAILAKSGFKVYAAKAR
jgi:very-short-patch-repair endonuclease